MGSKLDLYVQTSPKRRIAIVSQNPSCTLPLYVSLDESQSVRVIGVDMRLGETFDPSEWRWVNQVHGYLGNVSLATAEVFAVFITNCTPVARLPNPKVEATMADSNYPYSKDLAYIHHINQVCFLSLSNGYYDSDPDITPTQDQMALMVEGYDSEPEVIQDSDSDDGVGYVSITKDKGNGFRHPIRSYTRPAPSNNQTESVDYPYDELKKLLMTQYFYFSNEVDLTRTMQAKYINKPEPESVYHGDRDFLWNASLLTCQLQLLEHVSKNDPTLGHKLFQLGFITPIIQGQVNTFHTGSRDEAATLVSRVGWKRAGTRFHSRGIDDEGYTANFVETELVVAGNSCHFGFTTVRGSVPAFWTQEGNQLLGHRIQMTRGLDATQPAYDLHVEWLAGRYGGTHIINLLGQRENSAEATLSQRFERLVADGRAKASFTSFDFHAMCKNNQYEPARQLIDQLGAQLRNYGYFMFDLSQGRVLSKQTGVMRTNCLDCLDRTNVIQGLLLNFTLENFDVPLSSHSLRNPLATAVSENGDAISRIYAGTGALQSGVAASGKASLVNRLQDASKSVSRLYLHHFHDRGKQEAINILVGRNHSTPRLALTGYAPPLPPARKNTSTPWSLMVHCGTYNVNGRIPSGASLVPWLKPQAGARLPDIYALAFEEIVELTPSQIIAADEDTSIMWESLLSSDLAVIADGKTEYALLTSEQLVGICLFIYVKRDLLGSIHQVMRCTKKTGMLGMAGNKGAAAIRFRCHDTSLCFVACHFASGQSKVEERNKDFNTIHNGIYFPSFGALNQHDALFYIGDFNYRVNCSNEQVRFAVSQGQLESLIKKDQLLESQRYGVAFSGFREGPITFPPTYKYDVGKDIYDTSEKRRIPAWTDRILYRGFQIEQKYYNHCLMYESDHRPVVAGFIVSQNHPVSAKKLVPPPIPQRNSLCITTPAADKEWWEQPLPPLKSFSASLIESEDGSTLSELDSSWRSQAPSNPFRQPGLKGAFSRMRRKSVGSHSAYIPLTSPTNLLD
ncbi:Inositol-1,4,5-trisphosphate 5-phosphatase 1, variant 2 [Entomophthora muscae]|uniref:Inositol-1,4,5-trisphosphate 5-phosphatase 1, variant 2 n=1 Tax=Entomophthora muscae TaxID=34485 RepID=A0ACC2UKW3_9FUNG|nr:Inositol-1,4,5-trisphosphate 5-phosphatase 1, variant 2 [Entomophthora muscae]